MEKIPEKNIFSGMFEREEKTPKPKVEEPSEEGDELPTPEQTDEERKGEEEKLTKEDWEMHPEELKEITELAKGAGFKETSITNTTTGTRFENPDTFFFLINHLNNFFAALKFIEKKDLYQGMKIELSEVKKRFKWPKLEIYRKFNAENNKLKRLRDGEGTDEKELIQEEFDSVIVEKNIDKLDKEIDEYRRSKLSESKIKKQTFRFIITDIIYGGIENSAAVNIARLKELKDKKKILSDDDKKQFKKSVSSRLRSIYETFPHLDDEIVKKLRTEWLKTGEKFGKEYLEKEKEGKKYDFNVMHR